MLNFEGGCFALRESLVLMPVYTTTPTAQGVLRRRAPRSSSCSAEMEIYMQKRKRERERRKKREKE